MRYVIPVEISALSEARRERRLSSSLSDKCPISIPPPRRPIPNVLPKGSSASAILFTFPL